MALFIGSTRDVSPVGFFVLNPDPAHRIQHTLAARFVKDSGNKKEGINPFMRYAVPGADFLYLFSFVSNSHESSIRYIIPSRMFILVFPFFAASNIPKRKYAMMVVNGYLNSDFWYINIHIAAMATTSPFAKNTVNSNPVVVVVTSLKFFA